MLEKITLNTNLVVKKDWQTPYHYYRKGEYADASYWAKKLGKNVGEFW
jgi:hypothetical protein